MNDNEIIISSNVESLELYSDKYPFRLSFRIKRFETENEMTRFIKNCEKLVRGSLEYSLWRSYIIDVLQHNKCVITNERMDEVSIDIHHHIPDLFTLIKTLVCKKLETDEEFSTYDIALETIELHFMNKVGYVTLLKSMHEKFHNGYLQIPMEYVRGDYNYFLENLTKYLEEDELEKINYRLATKESNCKWNRDEYPGLLEAAVS